MGHGDADDHSCQRNGGFDKPSTRELDVDDLPGFAMLVPKLTAVQAEWLAASAHITLIRDATLLVNMVGLKAFDLEKLE